MTTVMTGTLMLWLVSAALPAEPLWVELGPTNQEHGLSSPSIGDGSTVAEVVGGSPCRRTGGRAAPFLYVKADAPGLTPGRHDVYLAIEYFDERLGIVRVEYDKAPFDPTKNSRYTKTDERILMTGSRTWQRAVVHLPDARLAHQQNSQADARLMSQGLAVRRLELSFTKPRDYWPHGINTVALEKARARIGSGMELDFGCDPSPVEAAMIRMLGGTSAESYLTWESVESKGEGQWDWSSWDRQIAILRTAGLKWAPLVVAGPAYATPKWFRESSDSVPYICLEHGEPTKIQSLWNPRLRPWLDRFMKAVADRYRDRGVLELVRLGVTGTYGETLFPSGSGTGWTFHAEKPIHNHRGWWAGDRYAIDSFRRYVRQRYADVDSLNRAWGSQYKGFDAVVPLLPEKMPSHRARMDFINWYLDSMTEFNEFWVAMARKHFPGTPIYQSVGGAGDRIYGADFTAQAKAVVPYGARLRVTNEASDYAQNFAITREVVSACRAYGLDIGMEPASHVTPPGNIARIYNATASGAVHLFCYNGNVLYDPDALASFRRYVPMLERRRPQISAAVYLPKTSWALDEKCQGRVLAAAAQLRDSTDLELLDGLSIRTPLARGVKVLAIPDSPYAERSEIDVLRQWVSAGGILVVQVTAGRRLLVTPEGSDAGCRELLAQPPADAQLTRMTLEGSPPRHFRLHVGTPGDDDYLWGSWHGREPGRLSPDGPGMRWTSDKAGLAVPCDPSSDATLVLAARLCQKPKPGTNRVLVNGVPVGSFDKPSARSFRFNVPKAVLAGSPVAEVTFEVPVVPSTGRSDSRMLGLAVGPIEMIAAGAENEPVTAPRLVAEFDWSRAGGCVRHIGRGATLAVPCRRPRELQLAVVQSLAHPEKLGVAGPGADLPSPEADGVFATQCSDGVLYYNASEQPRTVRGVAVPGPGIAWKKRMQP